MEEIKEKLVSLKQALPMMRDFGGLDNSALKTITESLEEVLNLYAVDISFCFDDEEISDLVTEWISGFENITERTKTNLEFGFQEGIYKIKEVLKN